jgi:hypothetical protein
MSGSRLRGCLGGLALLITGLLPSGCVEGGGTDIGNALVQGTVTDEGAPVAGAEVILMPAEYNPVMGDPSGRTRSVLTAADGTFRFEGLAPGAITLEALHPARERMDWMPPHTLAAGDTLAVAVELAPARTLVIRLPAEAAPDAYAFLPGTDVHADRNGGEETLQLPHVPADSLEAIGIGSRSAPAAAELYRIGIGPADTAVDLRGMAPAAR